MVTRIHLKSREYLMGNVFFMCLFFTVGFMLLFCFGLIPDAVLNMREFSNSKLVGFSLSAFLLILSILILSAMSLSADRFFFKKAKKQRVKAGEIFFYLHPKKLFKCCVFFFKLSLFKFVFFVLCFSPLVGVIWLLKVLLTYTASVKVVLILVFCGVVLFVNSFCFYQKILTLAFAVKYNFIDEKEKSFFRLCELSFGQMKGKTKLLFRLKVSFLPRFLLCVFILPVPYVFCLYSQSLSVAMAEITDK